MNYIAQPLWFFTTSFHRLTCKMELVLSYKRYPCLFGVYFLHVQINLYIIYICIPFLPFFKLAKVSWWFYFSKIIELMDTVSTCIQPICVISRVQARINSINNFIKYKNKKKKGFKIKIFINCVHTCIILL